MALDALGRQVCGATVTRCAECDTSVAPHRVRRGQGCPKHPDAELVAATCGQTIAAGMTRCRFHGGRAPQVVAKQAAADEEAKARKLLEALGQPPEIDHPIQELLRLAAECKAWLGIIRGRLGELDGLADRDNLGVDRERALVGLYGQALDRCQKQLADLLRLDLERREVELDEAEAAQLAGVFDRAILTAVRAGLSSDLERILRSAIAAELRSVPESPSGAMESVSVVLDVSRPVLGVVEAETVAERPIVADEIEGDGDAPF